MKRLSAIKLMIMSLCLMFSIEAGKNDKDKKKDDGDKSKTQVKAVSGTIVMHQRGITKSYRILGQKGYSISRSAQGKILQYEGEVVTIHGTIIKDKIVKIIGVVKGSVEAK